jgi:hypothetical protein
MKKFLATTLASVTFLLATGALAGPAALAKPGTSCSQCREHIATATALASSRGSLYSANTRPCPRGGSVAARWGNGQKPCAHCAHHAHHA